MPVLDPQIAMTAVDTAVQGGKVVELLTPSQPALHTTEVPMELFPEGPPQPPPTPSPPPTPRVARVEPPVAPTARRVPVVEEQQEMERQEQQQMARKASEDLLHMDRLAEDTGAIIESAARLGQQQREHGDMEYEEPAAAYVSNG
ncbi:hypothetical protein DUNSADRAFT_4599 [Dunaliella salina]|uniref:Encoded protein n=1 Tax=Dunaliella salina TaxID=3046 RepID=A0ABQ7GRR6_DUNSA|nr:hypothetical protein DUNSADRAFT_4599 [Dunaliella salina]|eukprot:KAF5837272.1 hypothetical protein DUNSADRAFT_4599 [Dunaliella salina]